MAATKINLIKMHGHALLFKLIKLQCHGMGLFLRIFLNMKMCHMKVL